MLVTVNYKNFENLVEAYSKSEKLKKDFKLLIFGGEKIKYLWKIISRKKTI